MRLVVPLFRWLAVVKVAPQKGWTLGTGSRRWAILRKAEMVGMGVVGSLGRENSRSNSREAAGGGNQPPSGTSGALLQHLLKSNLLMGGLLGGAGAQGRQREDAAPSLRYEPACHWSPNLVFLHFA